MGNIKPNPQKSERLLSLDFFRGITMFLLVAEGTRLWSVLVQDPVAGTIFETFFVYGYAILGWKDCRKIFNKIDFPYYYKNDTKKTTRNLPQIFQ